MFEAQLRDVPFFSHLSKRELATVAQQADEVDIQSGRELTHEGAFGHEFFVIIDGTAEVLHEGRCIAELGPGEFFGEMALVDEERRTATVKAISPMRLLVMTRQAFRTVDREMPQIHQTIADAINQRRSELESASAG